MTRAVILALVAASMQAVPAAAELHDADLDSVRVVSQRDWLSLRLQVLGVALSYPAYRVVLELSDSNRVRFVLWISGPMAQQLQESGRAETERVLVYHAHGIQNRVADLLQEDFPQLWHSYEAGPDFGGEFMVPGADLQAPPQRWALWREEELLWEP